MTSGAGASFTYDEANRVSSITEYSGGQEEFSYSPDNKMVEQLVSGTFEYTWYGAKGEKLGKFYPSSVSTNPDGTWMPAVYSANIWFGSKLIFEGGNAVYGDRLGTNRANGARFYPYGDEITSTANNHVKFATYLRDSYTGLDYADQRYYASTYGRFNTPDPYVAGGASSGSVNNPSDPGSWNRYAYTRGDPINRNDSRGMDDCPIYGFATGSGCDDGTDDPCDPDSAAFNPLMCQQGSSPDQPPDNPVPQVNCQQQLENTIDNLLINKGPGGTPSPLIAYDAWFVALGLQDNINPLLLVAVAGNESTWGTSHLAKADNNLFGVMSCHRANGQIACQPAAYSSFADSISGGASVLEAQIYTRGNNTVDKLYSGQKGAYCVDQPGFPCSKGDTAVTQILTGVGANPNKLGFPCPPENNP